MFYPSFIQHTHSFLIEGENNEDYSQGVASKKKTKKNCFKILKAAWGIQQKAPQNIIHFKEPANVEVVSFPFYTSRTALGYY